MKTLLALLLLCSALPAAAIGWPNCNVAGHSTPSGCCCATNTITGPYGQYQIWTCSCAVFLPSGAFPQLEPASVPPVTNQPPMLQLTNSHNLKTWLVGGNSWYDPEGNPVLTMFSFTCTNFLVRTTAGPKRVLASTNLLQWFPETYSVTGWISASATDKILCRQDTTFGSPFLGWISTPTNMFTIHYDRYGTPFETNWFRLDLTVTGEVLESVAAVLVRQSARGGLIPVPVSGAGRFFRME